MNMHALLLVMFLAQQTEQKPRWQPAWPCTGKEPSFDMTYLRTAEATAGQVFLFDRSEVARSFVLMTGNEKHRATISRAVGKLEKQYEDIHVPVDSTVDSLMIAASLQCMLRITIYDGASAEVKPPEDNVFRAGRIVTIPNPKPGIWTVRLEGAGPYSMSAQAHSSFAIHDVQFSDDRTAIVVFNAPTADARFKLIDAPASASQSLALTENQTGRFSGVVVSGFPQFRIAVEGTDERGYAYQRVFPRLIDSKP